MSNLSHNLSFSINLPKTTVHSEDIMTAVKETLSKFRCEVQFQDYSSFYSLQTCASDENECPPVMQSEKTILCEINAGLWDKALMSATSSLTKKTYPHYIIVQKFINYLLNAQSCTDFGLFEEFFWKLLLSHSPKAAMFDYYWAILCDHYVILNGKKSEEQSMFSCLIEALTNCLKKPESLQPREEPISSNQEQQFLEGIDNFNEMISTNLLQLNKKNIAYFEELPWSEKMKRCLTALNLVYNILETDFAFWLQSKGLKLPSGKKDESRSLLSCILWPKVRDVGIVNKEVHKVLKVYKLVNKLEDCEFSQIYVISKLVNLLGEVIRISDSLEEIKYPFLGTNSNNFARELSIILHQRLLEFRHRKEFFKISELILRLKSPWFRLLLCSHLLSFITGYQCPPELTGAYDILEHIALVKWKSEEDKPKAKKPKTSRANSKLVQKLRKLKSVNAKLCNGKTLLQSACETDNVEEVKALLTFPELDVNATDRDGWTALHVAAFKGNTASIQELLLFRPKSGDLQKSVNTRARGPESFTPLMCAVSASHPEACRLLLEHTGSVLLEDVNESNQTPPELSTNDEVSKILKHYKNNFLWTVHSHKDIDFDREYGEIVARLCVEMIQSYFCTHRTWDVYRTLKRRKRDSTMKIPDNETSADLEWDYIRYHRDIKRNIYNLRRLVPKLADVEEFKSSYEVFTRILSFNKNC